MNNKQELQVMLEVIKEQVSEGSQFVCNLARRYAERRLGVPYPYAIHHSMVMEVLSMVKMHIGNKETMEGFVTAELGYDNFVGAPEDVVQSYRIAMLNNMIKMVKGEPHA